MQVVQAFDGTVIDDVPVDDAASLESKLALAAATFRQRGAWLPPYARIAVLKKLALLMQRDAEDFASLIAREGGKPLVDAQVEVARAINGVESAVGVLEGMAGREIPMGLTPASAGRLAFTTREPIGVVVAISAFNHPLNLIVHQVVPAVATGCPVIVKPANPTPLCCLHFVKLAHEAGLHPAWCQTFVVEDLTLAERLATDQRVAFLSFIGSAKVGWYLRSRIAPGTRIALEHGGAAPVIIDRTAALNAVITPLTKGAFYHAGQVCVSVQRVFVEESRKAELVERLEASVRALRTGDPSLPTTDVGPLIRPEEVDRVETWVDQAIADGVRCVVGGKRMTAHVYQPTILVEPQSDSIVSQREIFGPVVCVYGYTEMREAIARANSLPYAFQAAVFTREIDTAMSAAAELDASAVMINDHTAFRTDWMPFAGRRQSGYGIGGIPDTMHDMTQEKMLVLRYLVK
jgi:acyl-CoA reductase-like NAD-dependent aldehyde dehydrogenase